MYHFAEATTSRVIYAPCIGKPTRSRCARTQDGGCLIASA